MKLPIGEKLKAFSHTVSYPVFVVGGFVRNFLIDKSISTDIDLCAPIGPSVFKTDVEKFGFTVLCDYKRTGTVVFSDGERRYEFTSFRVEKYGKGGNHTPIVTKITKSIKKDAKRRDFKCNAIYYDVKNEKIIDVLGGIKDIENKVLSTVVGAKKVFSHDGLRLMRLARFCGELSFTPSKKCLSGAKKYAKNISDIVPERIFEELNKILLSDGKYSFSDAFGHYNGLKILDETKALDYIFPELTLGRGMEQRKDFHSYDVLEHSLKTVKYSERSIRLSALFHDVGKPFCKINFGRYKNHDVFGEKIAKKILETYKAPKKTIEEVAILTKTHMFDLKGNESEKNVRIFIVENAKYFDKILLLKQADFSACKDDLSIAPSVKKLENVYKKMREEKIPFSEKALDITAKDLIEIGVQNSEIGKILSALLKETVVGEIKNEKNYLLNRAKALKN